MSGLPSSFSFNLLRPAEARWIDTNLLRDSNLAAAMTCHRPPTKVYPSRVPEQLPTSRRQIRENSIHLYHQTWQRNIFSIQHSLPAAFIIKEGVGADSIPRRGASFVS